MAQVTGVEVAQHKSLAPATPVTAPYVLQVNRRPVRTKPIPCVERPLVRTGQEKIQRGAHEGVWCAQKRPRAHGARNTEHRAQSTEHRTQNTEHRARNTGHETRNTKHGTQSTGHETRDTKHGTRNTEHGARDRKMLPPLYGKLLGYVIVKQAPPSEKERL